MGQGLLLTGKVDGNPVGSWFEHLAWDNDLIVLDLNTGFLSFTFVGFIYHHITGSSLEIEHNILLRPEIEGNDSLSAHLF